MKIFGIGGSMRPFIKNGSICKSAALPSVIKRGDVILCKIGDKYFIHRFIKQITVSEIKFFVMNDDAGIVGEHRISEKNLIAKVKMPWYLEGFLGLFLNKMTRCIFILGRTIKSNYTKQVQPKVLS